MGEVSMNLYDINKQLMAKRQPLDKTKVNIALRRVAGWVKDTADCNYLMLLCNDLRDYTVFNLNYVQVGQLHKLKRELLDVLQSRGSILDIACEDDACSIWIRVEDDGDYLYHFFPYDAGVVEV